MAVDENGNEIIQTNPELSGAQKRIKDLSEKVELTSIERDEKAKLLEEKDKEISTLKKESEFSNGFADVLGAHPQAKEHKDEIKAKVLAGYTVQDATFAVLGAAGKLGQTTPQAKPQVAGGSAVTTPASGEKEMKDMSLAEKRAILSENIAWS